MLRILNKILRTGIVTETVPRDRSLDELGIELKRVVDRRMRGSFAIRTVDAGSCNACELEVKALNNPFYDIERFGVHFVASPRHADALLVTGPVSRHMVTALERTYAATPAPKWVIATGTCAIDGGEFRGSYATLDSVAQVLPVDLVIPGCPPTPTDLLQGLLALLRGPANR